MVVTPLLQAKQEFDCRGAICHSGLRAGIQEKGLYTAFWMQDQSLHWTPDQVQGKL